MKQKQVITEERYIIRKQQKALLKVKNTKAEIENSTQCLKEVKKIFQEREQKENITGNVVSKSQ